jgi:riboflavin kinase/FMN adenylyltransferase
MAVYHGTGALPSFNNAVVTIGTFDGVHKGHRAILQNVAERATAARGESVLITFDPHPRKLLFPNESLGIITPLAQKLELVQSIGIQHVVVVPFTREFASLSARGYIEEFLVRHFSPHTIIIGYDHRFGNDRTGNISLLQELAPQFGYKVLEIPAQLIDQAAVSSTKIRNAVMSGNAVEATSMLGRPYSFAGRVVHGRQLGRQLGYPTANLVMADADQVVPGIGVYAVRVKSNGHLYGGMMSVGKNPTVSDTDELKIEVNIFDFNADIYGEIIGVFIENKIRNEMKFNSLEDLKSEIDSDKVKSLEYLKSMESA